MTKIDLKDQWIIAAAGYDIIKGRHIGSPVRGALIIGFDGTATFFQDRKAEEFIPEEGRRLFPLAEVELYHHPLADKYILPYEIAGWRTVTSAKKHFARLDINKPSSYGTLLTFADSPISGFFPGYTIEEFLPPSGSNLANIKVDMRNDQRLARIESSYEEIKKMRTEGNTNRVKIQPGMTAIPA